MKNRYLRYIAILILIPVLFMTGCSNSPFQFNIMNELFAEFEEPVEPSVEIPPDYERPVTTEEMNEMSDYEKDGIVEVNKSNFIIWNSEMEEPIIVDKLGSQIDVLPTLLNLFGIEYDSRLIVGKDILSDTGCVAIFSNYSWVSDYGTYFANKRQFVPKAGKTLENQDEYVKAMNNRVSNAYSISKMILDTDYYTYVLESE